MSSALNELNNSVQPQEEKPYEVLEYDTSSPLSYDEWKDKTISEGYKGTGNFWSDLWNGLRNTPRIVGSLFDAGQWGKSGYQQYVDQFYNDQSTRNSAIAEQNQRNYEEYMSSSAYQRGYKDLEKTGLNPSMMLLSAFNQASTPSSSIAFTRHSNQSSSRSDNSNRSNSATAVLAALIYLLGKTL